MHRVQPAVSMGPTPGDSEVAAREQVSRNPRAHSSTLSRALERAGFAADAPPATRSRTGSHIEQGGDRLSRATRAVLVVLLEVCILAASACTRRAATSEPCDADGTIARGVAWPGVVETIHADDLDRRRQLLAQARSLARTKPTSPAQPLESARIAAALGDLRRAVEAADEAMAMAPSAPDVRQMAGTARLARFLANPGDVEDLLNAGELLATAGDSVPVRCDRLIVLDRLGLAYQVAAKSSGCPCRSRLDLAGGPRSRFAPDGHRHSADVLPEPTLARVEALEKDGDRDTPRALVRASAQAWRGWLEHEALALWHDADDEAARRGVERRVTPLAELYSQAATNPAPLRVWGELAVLRPGRHASVRNAIGEWLAGSAAMSRYEPERAESALQAARTILAARVPSLLPSVDLALATSRFHLGDDAGMLRRSRAVRAGFAREAHPWAWARSLWLESLALQATADWSLARRRAEEAGSLYSALGEEANAGFQDTLRGVALEFEGADDDAAAAYLSAIGHIEEAGETRLLAGALALFARQQSRASRPHLAVELQRESTTLDSADAAPQLVAEAQAVLAELLFRAGATAEGEQALAQARAEVAKITSSQPHRRAEAILAHVEASGARHTDPATAEDALSRFLAGLASFGERPFRVEALIDRAEARLRLGKRAAAELDLADALGEIADQSARLEDRVRSVALLDRARHALDLLVEVLLASGAGGEASLRWIERLRGQQMGLAFGEDAGAGAQRSVFRAAPAGSCITELWAGPRELLAWTSCDREPPRLTRVPVARDRLVTVLASFYRAAKRDDVAALRRTSAAASRWLLAPLAHRLARAESWTVVPDALFPPIPIAWLTLGDRFLFEDRVVRVAPTWSMLEASAAGTQHPWRALAIGDPEPLTHGTTSRLPAARAEVARIASTFPGSAVLVGKAATWSSLVDRSGSFNLLHLGTHVSNGSRVPLSARLELAPEPARPDGRVAANEVARQPLAGLALTVVASCGSAASDRTTLSGSLDFANAFLTAGAGEVIGTLWEVPDKATSAAVAELYDGLRVGLPPEEALRAVWKRALADGGRDGRLSVRAALQLTSRHL